jgi:hypothetical protein
MKIYVTVVQALRKSERQDETPFSEFQTPLNDNVLFFQTLDYSKSLLLNSNY